MVSNCAKWLEVVCATLNIERRAPSAEAMTAPRAREQADPPSPPDRLPPRRGGRPSAETHSAAGRLRGLVRSGRRAVLAAAGLTGIVLAAGLALAPPAQAQTQIWSAAMTTGNFGSNLQGYSQPAGTGSLSDRTFTHDGINYTVTEIFTQPETGGSPQLRIALNKTISPEAVSDLTLVVGTDEFVWANGTVSPSGRSIFWRHTSLGWSAGTGVSLSLKAITGRPTIRSGQVRSGGDKIYLTFSEDVSGALPPTSAFTVTAGGAPVTVGSIHRPADDAIELRGLSPLILNGQTVTLTYTDPTTGDDANAIQDDDGTDAHSFTDDNLSNPSLVTLPKLTAAEVSTDGRGIALTFSENLDHPTYTATIRSAFTVTVDGTDTSVISTSGGMDKVNLTVSNTIGEGQTVVVSYDRSDAGTEAPGAGGNKVADFTTGSGGVPAVVNNSELDRSPPELTGATVTSSGVAIELAFDEDLDLPATIPAALKDAFSVTAVGDTVEISGLAADGSSGLQINLSSRILKDQAVVVSYDEVADFTTGSGGVPAVGNDSTELSDDATLSELIFSVRNLASTALEAVDLSPAFDPGMEMYSVSVSEDYTQVTFMPAVNHADATVAYFDGVDMALEDASTGTSGHQVIHCGGPEHRQGEGDGAGRDDGEDLHRDRDPRSPHALRGHGAGGRDVRRAPVAKPLPDRLGDAVGRGGRGLHGHRRRRRTPDNGHRAGDPRQHSERQLVHPDLPGPGGRRELRQRRRRRRRPRVRYGP